MDDYAYTSDERAVIVGNVDEVPDSPTTTVVDIHKEDSSNGEVNDEYDGEADHDVLPEDGVRTKRLKVERS